MEAIYLTGEKIGRPISFNFETSKPHKKFDPKYIHFSSTHDSLHLLHHKEKVANGLFNNISPNKYKRSSILSYSKIYINKSANGI